MNFRIKYLPQIGYFAQVKLSWLAGWKTIGKHINGYGLYAEDYIEHPLINGHEAEERCKLYEQWKVMSEGQAQYIIL